MNTQPEAIKFAKILEEDHLDIADYDDLAAELRRLHQSEHEGWRYANELEQERKRLHEAKQAMLNALKKFSEYESAMDAGNDIDGMLLYAELQAMSRAAIAKGEQQ